jgi:hypothetical protein
MTTTATNDRKASAANTQVPSTVSVSHEPMDHRTTCSRRRLNALRRDRRRHQAPAVPATASPASMSSISISRQYAGVGR